MTLRWQFWLVLAVVFGLIALFVPGNGVLTWAALLFTLTSLSRMIWTLLRQRRAARIPLDDEDSAQS